MISRILRFTSTFKPSQVAITRASFGSAVGRAWARGHWYDRKSLHPTRSEPVTFGSVDRCSIQLSYGCVCVAFDGFILSNPRSDDKTQDAGTRQGVRGAGCSHALIPQTFKVRPSSAAR